MVLPHHFDEMLSGIHQILFCLRQDFGAWRRFVAFLLLRRNNFKKICRNYLESARNRRNFASWLREIT